MNKNLLNKILVTLGFLFAYRVLAYVPVPGVNTEVIKDFFTSNSNNALGLFNMFSGNAAERLSIISLGIMPYITASIIMELLSATFPNLGKMKKERDGMQKYMQIIRYATIVITIIQAIGVSIGLQSLTGRAGEPAIMIDINLFIAISCASMLTGTMLLMWIGEQITQRGIGNGISLIIFAGIVSGIPSAIGHTINLVNTGEMNFLVVVFMALIILATVGIVIFVELGEKIMNYIPIKAKLINKDLVSKIKDENIKTSGSK